MRLVPLAALALLAMPLAAQAPSGQPGMMDPQRVVAGTYKVDVDHTQVTWRVNHMNFTLLQGQFAASGGSLTLDPRNPAATQLEVDFQLDQLSSSSPHLTEHMKSKEIMEAATYPTARFVSTSVAWQGTSATVTGNLTLHGATKPVTLHATLVGAGVNPHGGKQYLGIHATGSIRRTDFGITYAVPMVSDNVDLDINAGFVQS